MKKIFLLAAAAFGVVTLFGQQLNTEEFLKLSLEEKVDAFFETYLDGHTHMGVSRFAGYIVYYHGYEVMPFIKERLEQANYFTYTTEPSNITLGLIAYLMVSLHIMSGYKLSPGVPAYELTDDEIQWFFDEYMRRIDDYILVNRVIDEVVMSCDIHIVSITCATTYHRGAIIKFGYPFFGDTPSRNRGNGLKQYYEERLGIYNLEVIYPFLE